MVESNWRRGRTKCLTSGAMRGLCGTAHLPPLALALLSGASHSANRGELLLASHRCARTVPSMIGTNWRRGRKTYLAQHLRLVEAALPPPLWFAGSLPAAVEVASSCALVCLLLPIRIRPLLCRCRGGCRSDRPLHQCRSHCLEMFAKPEAAGAVVPLRTHPLGGLDVLEQGSWCITQLAAPHFV